jgi:hypothetical protein
MIVAVVFLGVGNAVIVFVVVGGAVVGRPLVEQDSTPDIAANDDGRSALEQVVGIELRRVGTEESCSDSRSSWTVPWMTSAPPMSPFRATPTLLPPAR